MNKLLKSFFIFFSSSIISFNNGEMISQNFYAKSYIVIDGNNGEILEGKDYHLQRSVASISKIMTALIALESEENLFYSFTIPNDAIGIEGSSVYLKPGDSYRLIDLIYGLLLRSGNDAAYAISLIVCNTTDEFVNLMNEKANKLGMKDTCFNNPCGLDIDDNGNLSTANDMALLMKNCLENSLFKEIISTKKYRFGNIIYENKNKLLKSYEYLIGGKTGFTTKARRTLVTAAEKDGQYLIMVTLDCGSDYSFHKHIYESYFDKYHYVVFLIKGKNYIDEYIFESDYVVGMRIEKKYSLKGIKKYFINPITKKLEITLILENGQEINGGEYKNIRLLEK